MNKVWLIIQREFLNRVQKKSFLLTTILVPLIIPAIMAVLVYVAIKEYESAKADVVLVFDESAKFNFENTKRFEFLPFTGTIESAKETYKASENFALLHIVPFEVQNPTGFTIYTKENPSIEKIGELEGMMAERIRNMKLEQYNIDKETLKNLKTTVNLKQINISDTGEEKTSNAGVLYGLGFALGILIYIFVLVYGIQIMQGVIDEKTSKIVEVIVSSVKPFQLMLGKILGIAAVGVMQFGIWILLVTFLSSGVLAYFGLKMPQKQMMEQVQKQVASANPEAQEEMAQQNGKVMELLGNINDVPLMKIALVFLFYFLGGYLMYGALFAAVGASVDSMQESQQFQFPITLPLLIGYFGLFMFVLRDPQGPVSFWLSMIPFTSPVAMVGRIAFGVEWWELALSMLLLAGGFLLTTWVAGRIYRVGILMTGAKINWRVMIKYFMMGK